MNVISIPRLVIAGVSSGAGKTSTMVGLIGALQARGLTVAAFKCGPDYLDPTYHTRVTGKPSHNLDGWMMGRESVVSTFTRAAATADIALIEGVMGLFDGASPVDEAGSTAEIAKWLAAPVLLTVDASGLSRTIAAIAHGFRHFDPALNLAGLICNRIGSRGHLDLLRQAVPTTAIVGGFPRQADAVFPQRHLGLRTADSQVIPETLLATWIGLVQEWFDLDAVLRMARSAPPIAAEPSPPAAVVAPGCRIGIAKDEAFHFYYPENLRLLELAGAELVDFSPLRQTKLPADIDGLYFGGGYPEEFAARLAANEPMRREVRDFASAGGPVYAECGGLMYLCEGIRALAGEHYPMVGLIPGQCRMFNKFQALGYVEVETQDHSILGPPGLRFRGHEFRYSRLQRDSGGESGVEELYRVRKRRGGEVFHEGYGVHKVLASYIHAHWASNPGIARGLVNACAAFGEQRR